MEAIVYQPIGTIQTGYKQKFGTPRQSQIVPNALGEIRLLPEVQPELSLEHLPEFSHVWLLWHFSLNQNTRFHGKILPPRSKKRVGLFASRSPHRPNPIGLSLVKLVKVEPPRIWVEGVDLVNGTPILDIKPYMVNIESVPEAKKGWLEDLDIPERKIEFTETAQKDLHSWIEEGAPDNIASIIHSSLMEDPRPRSYKQDHRLGEELYLAYDDKDIFFKFETEETILVTDIKPFHRFRD